MSAKDAQVVKESRKTQATGADAPAPMFKTKRLVTLPVLKLEVEKPVYFKFTEVMKIGRQVEEDKDAAIIANGINLATGEPCQFLVPAVMQGILHDEYGAPKFGTVKKGDPVTVLEDAPEGSTPNAYVGAGFKIVKHEKKEGKKYHPMTVAELDLDE